MYYQTQVRNLAHEADLQRQLIAVKYLQNKVHSENYEKLRQSKRLTSSRRQKDKQTAIHLARSRLESELDATKVSTNAILNRSRIQSALQNRQRNKELDIETKRSLMQQQQNYLAQLQAQKQLYLEKQRQNKLIIFRQHNERQEIYERILRQQEERIQTQVRQQQLQKEVYQQEIKRQLNQKYDLLTRPYYYY